MALKDIWNSAKNLVKEHSPELLTGMGIAGFFIAIGLAVSETPEAMQKIEEKKEELDVDELTFKEKVSATWKCYLPTAILSLASGGCIIGGLFAGDKKRALIMAAYEVSESAAKKFETKTKELIDAKAEEKLKADPISKRKEKIEVKDGDVLCYDTWSGNYFTSNYNKIEKAKDDFNKYLYSHDCGSVNDFYEFIGLPRVHNGDSYGWAYMNCPDGEGVELYYSGGTTDDMRPCLMISFFNEPKLGYDDILH